MLKSDYNISLDIHQQGKSPRRKGEYLQRMMLLAPSSTTRANLYTSMPRRKPWLNREFGISLKSTPTLKLRLVSPSPACTPSPLHCLTVNPPYFYGPFAPGYRNEDASLTGLSTNKLIYNLLRPDGPLPPSNSFIDVRDVARAVINALNSPPTSQVGRKRILMSGEWFSAKDAVDYIAQQRPQLEDRLTKLANDAPPAQKSPINNSRAKEVLGLEVTGWKETVLAAVDDLLRLEATWKTKGLTPR